MNRYLAFWRRQRIEVRGENAYAAQLEAARVFGARLTREIAVVLVEGPKGAVRFENCAAMW